LPSGTNSFQVDVLFSITKALAIILAVCIARFRGLDIIGQISDLGV
jgi:hypothetical protein